MTTRAPGDVDRERGLTTPGGFFLAGALGVAALLLFGAFAKVYTEATRETPTWPIGAILHAAFEVVVAFALLVMHRDRRAWGGVGALFAFFAGVTLHRLLGGYPSCGCFGKFSIPPWATLTLDGAIVAMSVGLARCAGLRGYATGWMAALILPLAIAGGVYSLKTSDPPPRAFDASKLKALAEADQGKRAPTGGDAAEGAEAMRTAPGRTQVQAAVDLSAQQALLLVPGAAASAMAAGAPKPEWLARLGEAVGDTGEGSETRAWLIFVYDPDCEVCKVFLPAYEQHAQFESKEAGARLRVIPVKKADLDSDAMGDARIADWAWPASPTVVLVRGGKIIHEWGGDKAPYPKVLQGEMEKGGSAYLEELERTHKVLTP